MFGLRPLSVLHSLPPDALLLPEEAAEILRVPARLLAEWRCARRGPRFEKLGHFVRYRKAEVFAALDPRETNP